MCYARTWEDDLNCFHWGELKPSIAKVTDCSIIHLETWAVSESKEDGDWFEIEVSDVYTRSLLLLI